MVLASRSASPQPTGRGTVVMVMPLALALLTSVILAFAPGCDRAPDQPNIVLVVLDTVRRDASGATARDPLWRELTPAFDRVASEGTLFTHAWAVAPWTVPSHVSLFTGHLPSVHGCTSERPHFRTPVPTAAEKLAEAGYATAAFFSNPWLGDKATGMLRGFAIRKAAPIGGLSLLTSEVGDQGGSQTLRNVAEWLEGRPRKQPFFLFVNLLEAHMPYDPPRDYRQAHLPGVPPGARISIAQGREYNAGLRAHSEVDWELVRQLYGGDVNTSDRFLEGLLRMLKGHELYEESVIIITSDHGENLGDHGILGHQFSVHETLLAVPLAIRAPAKMLASGRRSDPVQLTDLFATILAVAGIELDKVPPSSRCLFDDAPRISAERPLIAEYAGPGSGIVNMLAGDNPSLDRDRLARAWKTVRVGDLRLSLSSDGSVRLHDMSRDPDQSQDLSAGRERDVAQLTRILMSAAPRRALPLGEEVPLDSLTRRQLESLGYIR